MPEYYFKNCPTVASGMERNDFGDASWIRSMLALVDEIKRQQLCRSYSRIYIETLQSESNEAKRYNKARFNANSYLRLAIAKYFAGAGDSNTIVD